MVEAPIARWAGVALLLVMATVFGLNHIAARIAFEHGANVTTAVAVRSSGTSLFVFALLFLSGTSWRVDGKTLVRSVAIGLLVAIQSYCLYSAVSLIPVAPTQILGAFVVVGAIMWMGAGKK